MTTWTTLVSTVQDTLQDPTGVFHPTTTLQQYAEHAELLLSLHRSLYERTATLTFTASPVYVIHTLFPDFVAPLRVTVSNVPLRWTSLAAVGRLHRNWRSRMDEAESCFMIGATILGFSPLPTATSARVTYLAAPPTLSSTPASGTEPVIDPAWHTTMARYAEAIALAKESQYQKAGEALKMFLDLAKIPRDPRFLESLSQRSATTTKEPERTAND